MKVVAVGAGYAYGSLGATHQATEEIGALRTLPNMVVATPGDPVEARAIATLSANYEGPMYIRLGKAGEKIVHEEEALSLSVGNIVALQKQTGNRTVVLACGNILASAKRQIAEDQLPYDLYSVPFVKPLNREQLRAIVASYPDGLITIEEHQRSCGMGSAIVEQLNDLFAAGEIANYPKVRRVAIQDEFAGVVGNQEYLRKEERLNL